MKYKVGDRVVDKFKRPRPGDESNQGTVTHIDKHSSTVTVLMDTGSLSVKELPFTQFEALFELVEGKL